MLIDLPIATEAIDSSGEILEIKNVDISDFEEGRALANFEHDNQDPLNAAVGIFRYAKKILKESDCETDRQKKYWKQIQLPFIYGILELFDDELHPAAVGLASMIRFFANRKEPILVGASIEGATVEREGNVLKRAIARKCALTLKPCNKQCWVDLIKESDLKEVLKKFESSFENASKYTVELDSDLTDPTQDLKKAITDLNKTLTAGMGNVAPSQLTGGASLTKEHFADRTTRNTIKAAIRDWDRKRPLKEIIKAALPEVSDKYVDHFTHIAEDLMLKKGMPAPARIGSKHSMHLHDTESQRNLAEGIYLDKPESLSGPYKARNDKGDTVIARQLPDSINPLHAAMYSRLASDYFGLGDHVAPATVIKHEASQGKPVAITQLPSDSVTQYDSPEAYHRGMEKARESGLLHKMLLMDLISGHNKPNGGFMISKHGDLISTDNHSAFSYQHGAPEYSSLVEKDLLHPEAYKWLKNLDAKKLGSMLREYGNDGIVKNGIVRLKALQKMVDQVGNISPIVSFFKGEKLNA